ncbi:hypothetical protein WN51_14467 [Melipona quadrifasciata]|uniref:Uncharacterized protein n=1 Tax=Melipona quadrifasciata TaxID=166423 RepID=A0A0N0U545_9HYME|nr:hypothetical protein WN51_14467 [Melipona quadrifasciata]
MTGPVISNCKTNLSVTLSGCQQLQCKLIHVPRPVTVAVSYVQRITAPGPEPKPEQSTLWMLLICKVLSDRSKIRSSLPRSKINFQFSGAFSNFGNLQLEGGDLGEGYPRSNMGSEKSFAVNALRQSWHPGLCSPSASRPSDTLKKCRSVDGASKRAKINDVRRLKTRGLKVPRVPERIVNIVNILQHEKFLDMVGQFFKPNSKKQPRIKKPRSKTSDTNKGLNRGAKVHVSAICENTL